MAHIFIGKLKEHFKEISEHLQQFDIIALHRNQKWHISSCFKHQHVQENVDVQKYKTKQ